MSSHIGSARSKRSVPSPSTRSSDENMPLRRELSIRSLKQSIHTHRPGSARQINSRRSSPAVDGESGATGLKAKGTLRNRLQELRLAGRQLIANGLVEEGLAQWGRALKLHANNFTKLKAAIPPLWSASEEYVLIANNTAVERDMSAAPASSIIPLYQCILFLLSDEVNSNANTTANKNMSVSIANDATVNDSDELFVIIPTTVNGKSDGGNNNWNRRQWDRCDKVSYFAQNVELKQVLRSIALNNIAVHEHISNPAHILNILALLMKSLLYSNGVFCTLTLYNLAVIFMSCGRFDDAAEAIARCLELAQLYLTSSHDRMNKLNANTIKNTNMAASAPASSSSLSALSLATQKRKSTILRAEDENKYASRGSVVSLGRSKRSITSMYSISGVAAATTTSTEKGGGGEKGNVKVDEEAVNRDHVMCVHCAFTRLIASHVIHCHLLLATLASWSMVPDVAQQHCQLAMMCAEEHLMPSDPLYQVTYHRLRQAIFAWHSFSSSSSSSSLSWTNSQSSGMLVGPLDTNTPPKLPLIPFGEVALSSKVEHTNFIAATKTINAEPIRVSELLNECKGVKVPRELRTYLQAIQRYMRETEESIRGRIRLPLMTPASSTSQTLTRQRDSLRSLLQTEIFGPLLQQIPSEHQLQQLEGDNVPLFMQSLGLLQMHQQRENENVMEKELEEEVEQMHKGEHSEQKLQKDRTNPLQITNISNMCKNKEEESESSKSKESTMVTRIPDPALHRYKQLKHMTPHYLRQSTLLPPLPVSERNIRDSVTRNTAEVLNLVHLQSTSRTRSPRPSMEQHSSTLSPIRSSNNKLLTPPHKSSLSLSHVGASTLPLPNVHEWTGKSWKNSASHFMRQMDKSLKKFSQLVLDPLPALQIHACQVIQRAWRGAHARQLRNVKKCNVQEWLVRCDAAHVIWNYYVNWRSCKKDMAELHNRKRQCAQSNDATMLSSFVRARLSIECKGSCQLRQLVETYERVIKYETENAASILIQSIWRRVMVQHRLQQEQHAVITLQCSWRVFEAKRELRRRKVHKQLEYQNWLQQHYFHILDIQRWWRACHARIAVNGLLSCKQHAIADYLESSSLEYDNVLGSLLYEERLEQKGQLIVALFYGARDRAQMRILHSAHRIRCRIIRYWVLRYKGRKLLNTLRNEEHDRWTIMKRVEEVEWATLRLQCWCRRWLAQRQCESMRNALVHLHYMACQIQRCYRRYKLLVALSKLAQRARLRKEISEFAFLRERSATIIQATWKMYRVRSEWGLFLQYLLHDRHVYATRIQRIWRGYYARHVIVPEQMELYEHVTHKRQELLARLVALVKIQSFCKMCLQRNRFVRLHPHFAHAALLYSSENNESDAMDKYNITGGNATRYPRQKTCRSVLYMNHWPSRTNVTAAVKRIQRCWRTYAAKRRVCELALARAYGDSQRASHEALHGYATTIQSIVRAKLLNPVLITQQHRATSRRPRLSDLKQKFHSLPSEKEEQEEEKEEEELVTLLSSDAIDDDKICGGNEKERQSPIVTYTTNENSEVSYGNDNSETTTVRKESYPDLIVDESMSTPNTLCVMQCAISHLSHNVTLQEEEIITSMKEESIMESDSNVNDENDVNE